MSIIYTLYLKIHNVTKLKYLGFTKKNPHTYRGSGKFWKAHIKKYGYDVTTEILFQSENIKDIEEKGLYYSNLWNIVKERNKNGQKTWANLIPETAQGVIILTEEQKQLKLDPTIYTFRNDKTNEEISCTHSEFKKLISATEGSISRLITYKDKSYRGWRVVDVNGKTSYTDNRYIFKHSSGIEEICTQIELIQKYKLYKLHPSNISSLVRGLLKKYKGWTCEVENNRQLTLVKNRKDTVFYTFIHDSGIIETCSQMELMRKYPE